MLRRLEALLAVADRQHGFVVSGTGEIIEPDDGMLAIGSGGSYALASARALIAQSALAPAAIVRQALEIAAEICIYTNTNITVLGAVIRRKPTGIHTIHAFQAHAASHSASSRT